MPHILYVSSEHSCLVVDRELESEVAVTDYNCLSADDMDDCTLVILGWDPVQQSVAAHTACHKRVPVFCLTNRESRMLSQVLLIIAGTAPDYGAQVAPSDGDYRRFGDTLLVPIS